MNVVMDACALIAYVRGEEGADNVRMVLDDKQIICRVHVVNLGEVYYDAIRRANEQQAKQIVDELERTGLLFHNDIDTEFWQTVARYKATLRRVSLADCFVLALAQRTKADIVTSDHHEFDSLVEQKVCTVRFIR